MDLAMRDHKIFQMKAELENRKKTLCAKRRELATNTRENVFLIQYIDNITGELQLTDGKLKESKLEQREIMKEMEHLKNDLDNLVTN